MIVYWDPIGGNDGDSGLAIDLPKKTLPALIALLAGGVLNDGDEIRMLRQVTPGTLSGTGSLVFSQDSVTVQCPVDTAGAAPLDLVQGPNGKFYHISAVNFAGGTFTLEDKYDGATASVASASVLSPPAAMHVDGEITGVDLACAGPGPATFSGGWYDSGGATPAQDTVLGRVMPTVYTLGVAQQYLHGIVGDMNNIVFENLAIFGAGGGETCIQLDLDTTSSDTNSFSNCHFDSFGGGVWIGMVGASMTFSDCSVNLSPFLALTPTGAAVPVYKDLSILNCKLASLGNTNGTYLMFTSDPQTLLEGLTITGLVHGDTAANAPFFARSLMDFGGVGGLPRIRGLDINGVRGRGISCSFGSILLSGVLRTSGTNSIQSIDYRDSTKGEFVVMVMGDARDLDIRDIQFDSTSSLFGGVLINAGNSDPEDPLNLYNIQVGQRDVGAEQDIVWAGFGHAVFSECSFNTIGTLAVDLTTLGFASNPENPGSLRTVENVSGVPGNEITYLGNVDDAFMTRAMGIATPDTSIQVSGKSLKIEDPGYAPDLIELAVPVRATVPAGSRTVQAKIRKNVTFAAGALPGLRVTWLQWSGGQLVRQTSTQRIDSLDTDVWVNVSIPITLEFDQPLLIEFVGLTTAAGGVMWMDDFVVV